MKMSAAAKYMQSTLTGDDTEFVGVSIDSRKIERNNLFLAIKGPNHDAHDYVQQAQENGAVGSIVEKAIGVAQPHIKVRDSRYALGQLAAAWRQTLQSTRFIGVTGSNGKTTVKEMLAAILATAGNTIATKGNLNNDIGMPLTLLDVRASHDYAVIEMGANKPKEIDYLASIAKPHVALVNNAGAAHLEGFGSVQGVAESKGEIYRHLSHAGTAVINFDDKYAPYWLKLNEGNKVITFSLDNKNADVVGRLSDSDLKVTYQGNSIDIQLPLPGEHNARNALAAAAVTLALGFDIEGIKQGLESMQSVHGRLHISKYASGNIVIDDTYNANPNSFKAAIDVLAKYNKRRCLIMGDMAELGRDALAQHADIGIYAKDKSVQELYCYGELSKAAAQSFSQYSKHYMNKEELFQGLQKEKYKDTVFLVKGSRSAAMEDVVEFLKHHLSETGE